MPIREVLIQPFGSKPAVVDRMLGPPPYADDLAAGDADVNAASN
jgi:hypothetical protein